MVLRKKTGGGPRRPRKEEREDGGEEQETLTQRLIDMQKAQTKERKSSKKKLMKQREEGAGLGGAISSAGVAGQEEELDEEDEELKKELLALGEIRRDQEKREGAKAEDKSGKGPAEQKPKPYLNLKEEMLATIPLLKPSSSPWIERLDIASTHPVVVEKIDDDFKRELAFYEQALEAVKIGKDKVLKAGVPFERPEDYFAEMIKSDDHMMKVRQHLIEESQRIKRSEDAAKSRMLKKYAKEVQVQKIQDKAKEKTKTLEKIKLLRKGKKNLDNLGDDDFNVEVDDDLKEKPPKEKREGRDKKGKGRDKEGRDKEGKRGRDKDSKQLRGKSGKRKTKDAKYGFGGKKRHSKSNDAESTNHFGKHAKKTRTGLPPKSKDGGKISKKRPGKSKRDSAKGGKGRR